jgi:hypothetical protein
MNHALIKSKIDNLSLKCRKILAEYADNRANTSWLWGSRGAIWGYDLGDIIGEELDSIVHFLSNDKIQANDLEFIDEVKKSLYLLIKNYLVEMAGFESSNNIKPFRLEYYKILLSILKIQDIKSSELIKTEFEIPFFKLVKNLYGNLNISWTENISDVEKIVKQITKEL